MKLHLEEDSQGYYVKDVYCNKEFDRTDGVGPMRIPNSTVINCEHSWPQSKFSSSFKRNLQKSDLHHLFPTDSRANSIRGNHPFGNVIDSGSRANCEDSRLGDPGPIEKIHSAYFEPPDEQKGNSARAIFYFLFDTACLFLPYKKNI